MKLSKKNKTYLFVFVGYLILLLPLSLAYNAEVSIEPTSFSNLYSSDTRSGTITIRNVNEWCDIRCSYGGTTTSEFSPGKERTMPFSVTAPSSGPSPAEKTLQIECYDAAGVWPCTEDTSYPKSVMIYFGYCGDNNKQSGETCSSCPQDVRCNSNQACNNGECVTLNTNQNCGAIGHSCSSNEECINQVCKSKCGNGRQDSGETCANCAQDVRCGSNQGCSSSGQCIQLGTAQNCASVGDSCGSGFCDNNKCVECRTTSDCTSKKQKESTGKYECSSDRKGRYEVLVERGGQCIGGKCTGSNEIKSSYLSSCGDVPCYNGQCGCSEGYGTCKETWSCVKRGTILVGQPCDCDVQCESGFCKDKKCIKTIDVTLSSTKSTLKPGEETTVTLSISSNLDDDVSGSATLKIGSGTEMIDIRSTVDECLNNICKISGILPGRGSKSITVTLKSNSEVAIPISADVSYKVEGIDVQIPKSTSIEFTESKKEARSTDAISIIELTKNFSKEQLIGAAIVFAIVIIGLLLYFLGKKHRPKRKHEESKEHEKKDGKKESKKEGEICERCGKKIGAIHICKGKKEEPKPSGEIAKQIEDLHSLMEKGILTKREFKKKKKKLLRKV